MYDKIKELLFNSNKPLSSKDIALMMNEDADSVYEHLLSLLENKEIGIVEKTSENDQNQSDEFYFMYIREESELDRTELEWDYGDYGYSVKKVFGGYLITTPDTNQTVILDKNQRIVVVNNDPKYRWKVSKPEHVITALQTAVKEYTQDNNIGSFVVKNICTGKSIKNFSEVDTTPVILFVSVMPYNKAGIIN